MGDSAAPPATNDVTMQGSGVYSDHSDLQHEVMLQALPLIEKSHKNSRNPERWSKNLQIFLNDKPNNDFITLSSTISEWAGRFTKAPFVGMIPGNFYDQILPANSVDLGFSLASVQHLRTTRPMMDDNLQRSPNADKLLQEQAHKDLFQFLHHRGIETKPGGSPVLSFPSKSISGPSDLVGPTTSIFGALKLMLAEGKVSKRVLSSLNEPLYNRSMEDVQSTLNEVDEVWDMQECFESRVVHPAYLELQKVKSDDGLVDDETAFISSIPIYSLFTSNDVRIISPYRISAHGTGMHNTAINPNKLFPRPSPIDWYMLCPAKGSNAPIIQRTAVLAAMALAAYIVNALIR
ncbi:Benzoate carboxyl methyltransferase [Penicillium subrubescens]|uniref:Benzoate carboxyl methyltransferase n=1 Tax=Penicillium subrubescens TaxID=1316194 RepID=A0A1Q5ULW8_9EURO|nr:Benzoate carboxyl methyltransferase [Penicillium subrubescens]